MKTDENKGGWSVLMSRAKTFAVVGGAVGSWAAAYWYFANSLDKSSSLVTQTLFNINNNSEQFKEIRSPIKLNSSIRGKMNQFKGFAEINFDVYDNVNKKYLVDVKAHRQGLNWRTDSLSLTNQSGQEIKFI